jgi:predicted ArsR family transcriptional regulator
MTPEQRNKEVSKLLADDYSQKILVSTYSAPMSAQRLSKICQIPIAACYRRIHDLESVGLLGVDREKEVYKGRKVRLYRCRLRSATIRFLNGRFVVRYDMMPENGDNGDNGGDQPTPASDAVQLAS